MKKLRKKLFTLVSVAIAGITLGLMNGLVFADSTSALLPLSDGTYEQWTRVSSGSIHYTAVDESECNGTTDYIKETTVGGRESFNVGITSVPNGAVITDISIAPCASRNGSTGGGSSVMDAFYIWNGADSEDAGNYNLTGTTPVELSATSFSDLALLKCSSSALQIGADFSSGNRVARISRLAAVLTYVTKPADVTNIDASNVSGTRNDITWSDNSSNENGFKVSRKLDGGVFSQIATTSADVVSYSDTAVTEDQTYYYYIRAYNIAGESGFQNIDYAITATVVPNDPSNLTANASSTSAALSWEQDSANEEGFSVERSTDGVNFSEIASKGINATTHTDPNLSSGTYYYRVRAFNAIGNSGYSNTASLTMP